MASVQFYGSDKAIEAYNDCKVPAWGLFSGRQLICKYAGNSLEEGSQLLEEFCQRIEHSNATYTLKVFENPSKKELTIKEKTECDLSFNFKLCEQDLYVQRREQRGYYTGGGNNDKAILDKLGVIENRLNQAEDHDPLEEQDTIGSIALSYLKEPDKLLMLLSGLGFTQNNQQPARALGNVTQKPTITPADTNDRLTRLSNAIDRLEIADPKIVEHLEKLAELAEDNKPLFNMMIKQLENL